MSVALDVVTYLSTTIATLTTGTNLFIGTIKDNDLIQDESVFVKGTGGRKPKRTFCDSLAVKYPKIQIVIRSNSLSTGASSVATLADLIYTAMNSDIAGYKDVKPLQSEFVDLGEDEKDRNYYSCNFELME